MKVLYVASEAVPFAKTGGLADVAGSLPKALIDEGVDIRVIMPKFGKISDDFKNNMEHIYDGELNVSWRSKFVGVDKYVLDGVTYYFIDNQEYYNREGFYGYEDDAERFSFFCRAVLNLLPAIDFFPDIIHTNDWHAGLVNVFLKLEHQNDERYQKIKTLYTIHNLKYQGVFPKDVMDDVLGLDWKYFNNGDLEFYDAVNFMKGGLIYTDYISTVSRTYAEEPFDIFYADIRLIKYNGKTLIKHSRLEKHPSSRNWNHPTTFVTRQTYQECGLFACKGFYDDYDLVLRIRRAGKKVVIRNRVLANFRCGGVSNAKGLKACWKRILDRYRVYRDNGFGRIYFLECAATEVAKLLLS